MSFIISTVIVFFVVHAIWQVKNANFPGHKLSFSGINPSSQASPTSEPVEPEMTGTPEIVPNALVVRDINGNMATLMIRYRGIKKAWTAHLIIWSGRKRSRIQDSYYDLGLFKSDQVGDVLPHDFIDEAIEAAQVMISGLAQAGKRKSRAKLNPLAEVSTEVTDSVNQEQFEQVAVVVKALEPTVSVEDNVKPDAAIKMRKFPSIYRGLVLEIGYMQRATDEKEFNCFGVRYRTAEGVEDIIWGVNLKTAFNEAQATVGDEVEILKIGRKIIEENKAPMNLYKVAKINPVVVPA